MGRWRTTLLVTVLVCALATACALFGTALLPAVVGSAIGAALVLELSPIVTSRDDTAVAAPKGAPSPELAALDAETSAPEEPASEATASAQPASPADTPEEAPAEPTSSTPEPAAPASGSEPATDAETPEPAAEAARIGLDMGMLARALFVSNEPIEVLRLVARDIKTRKTNSSLAPICTIPKRPTGAELYLLRMLTEAGIFGEDLDGLTLRIARLTTSGLFYVRLSDERLPFQTLVRLVRIESSLNTLQMASDGMGGLSTLSLEGAYELFQRIVGSIEAEPLPAGDEEGDGEWAARHHISLGLESMRLPFRLHADFRVNLAEGRVAFEAEVTPPEAFPSSAAVPGIGIVPATHEMRELAARGYNLRIAHLLAALAFGASAQVRDVWVAGVLDTPIAHECHYSVHFDRERFERLDLASGIDPVASALSFGATVGEGSAFVEQGFSLSDEAFCPTRRYEAPERSTRKLAQDAARALGTNRVCGLSVDESDRRTELAERIMRGFGSSTSENVSLILALVENDPDPTVHLAAERTVAKLIDGTIDEDPLVVAEEFCDGDALTRAVERAKDLIASGDPEAAERVLARVLAPLEENGTYDDSPTVRYRFFSGYSERVLYNRMFAKDGVTTLLVPGAYPWAVVLRSVAQLMQGRPEEALAGARRGVELSPLSAQARLHLVQCLEVLGRADEALQALNDLLDVAHDGFGVGFAYYRLAFLLWQRGDASGARACYRRAVRYAPITVVPIIEGTDPSQIPTPADLRNIVPDKRDDKVLAARSIPLAPTKRVRDAFSEAARAAIDAEVFPVARSIMRTCVEIDRDDVTFGVLRSLEDEPDR